MMLRPASPTLVTLPQPGGEASRAIDRHVIAPLEDALHDDSRAEPPVSNERSGPGLNYTDIATMHFENIFNRLVPTPDKILKQRGLYPISNVHVSSRSATRRASAIERTPDLAADSQDSQVGKRTTGMRLTGEYGYHRGGRLLRPFLLLHGQDTPINPYDDETFHPHDRRPARSRKLYTKGATGPAEKSRDHKHSWTALINFGQPSAPSHVMPFREASTPVQRVQRSSGFRRSFSTERDPAIPRGPPEKLSDKLGHGIPRPRQGFGSETRDAHGDMTSQSSPSRHGDVESEVTPAGDSGRSYSTELVRGEAYPVLQCAVTAEMDHDRVGAHDMVGSTTKSSASLLDGRWASAGGGRGGVGEGAGEGGNDEENGEEDVFVFRNAEKDTARERDRGAGTGELVSEPHDIRLVDPEKASLEQLFSAFAAEELGRGETLSAGSRSKECRTGGSLGPNVPDSCANGDAGAIVLPKASVQVKESEVGRKAPVRAQSFHQSNPQTISGIGRNSDSGMDRKAIVQGRVTHQSSLPTIHSMYSSLKRLNSEPVVGRRNPESTIPQDRAIKSLHSFSDIDSNVAEAREGRMDQLSRQFLDETFAADPDKDLFDIDRNSQTKMLLYARIGIILVIFVADAIGFLVLQLLWRRDFMCVAEPSGHLHGGHLSFLIVILLMHSVYILDVIFGHTFHASQEASLCVQIIGKHKFDLWYILVLIASMIVIAEHASLCRTMLVAGTEAALDQVQRWHIVIHTLRLLNALVRCVRLRRTLKLSLQTLVSTNKRRFRDKTSALDLDLTYICDRLIAMALPGVQGAVYRNDIKEVAHFFATRHYASFCVVNLTEGFEEHYNGDYDPGLLFGQVQRIPFHDHSAPSLKILVEFCEKATAWLNENSRHVIAVHCRGGKGRTGTFCSALMRWTGLFSTVGPSAEYYARRRTMPLAGADVVARGDDGAGGVGAGNSLQTSMQGIDAPSQKTILRYLHAYMTTSVNVFAPPGVLLSSVTIKTLPLFDAGRCRISLIVFNNAEPVYDYGKAHGWLDMVHAAERMGVSGDALYTHEWTMNVGLLHLSGDVSIRFYAFGEDCDQIQGITGVLLPGAQKIDYGSVRGKLISFVSLNTALLPVHAGKAKALAAAAAAAAAVAAAESALANVLEREVGENDSSPPTLALPSSRRSRVRESSSSSKDVQENSWQRGQRKDRDRKEDRKERGEPKNDGRMDRRKAIPESLHGDCEDGHQLRRSEGTRAPRHAERRRRKGRSPIASDADESMQPRSEENVAEVTVSGREFGTAAADEFWEQGRKDWEADDAQSTVVVTFAKSEIDGAHNDVKCQQFCESFSISLAFIRSFDEGLRKEGGSQPSYYAVNGVNLGLSPALQKMRLDQTLADLFASSSLAPEVFGEGTVLNSLFSNVEPLTASELDLVRQHIQQKRSGIISPDPLARGPSPHRFAGDPLARALSPVMASADAAGPSHSRTISGPANGRASLQSDAASVLAPSAVSLGDQHQRPLIRLEPNGLPEERPQIGLQGQSVGASQRRLSIGWVEEGLVDVDICHRSLGIYREDGALNMAGVPMHVLGVQGRGRLVNSLRLVTHLASLCGGITREREQVMVTDRRSGSSIRVSRTTSAVTRAEARLPSAARKEVAGEEHAAAALDEEECRVYLRIRVRSEKLRVSLSLFLPLPVPPPSSLSLSHTHTHL